MYVHWTRVAGEAHGGEEEVPTKHLSTHTHPNKHVYSISIFIIHLYINIHWTRVEGAGQGEEEVLSKNLSTHTHTSTQT